MANEKGKFKTREVIWAGVTAAAVLGSLALLGTVLGP